MTDLYRLGGQHIGCVTSATILEIFWEFLSDKPELKRILSLRGILGDPAADKWERGTGKSKRAKKATKNPGKVMSFRVRSIDRNPE